MLTVLHNILVNSFGGVLGTPNRFYN